MGLWLFAWPVISFVFLSFQDTLSDPWEVSAVSDVPAALSLPRRCVVTAIDGEMGLFTRYGYFYNIEEDSWTKKAYPPYEQVGRAKEYKVFFPVPYTLL